MNCVKGEIHNVLSMMRVNARWASHDRFRQEIPASTQSPLMRAFKQLHFALQTVTELNDVDTVTYLLPFIMVIESDKTSGFITGSAISSLNKFLLYRLLTCESVRADVAINRIALCISRCRFEETYRVDDEEVLMKLLEMVEYCIRSDAAHLLSTENVWKMVHLCYNICYQPGSSLHLSRAAENTLGHVILTVFDRIGELSTADEGIVPSTSTQASTPNTSGKTPQKRSHKVYRPFGIDLLERILNFLAQLISPAADAKGGTCILGLRLINIVLETAGTALGEHLSLVYVLQGDLSKYLLQNSETDELRVLSLVLRVVFNLFNSIKNHLKIQLEVFFTSVHMRIIDSPSCSDEQKELALESLLEFCREPALMLDLYINYDCDVHCTNLFEVLCSSLARNCQVTRVNGRLNALSLLCLEGLLAVVESIARRCSVPSAPVHYGAKALTQNALEPNLPLSQSLRINVLELQGHELAKFTARKPSSHGASSWDITRSNNTIDLLSESGKKGSFSDFHSPPSSLPSSQKDNALDDISPLSSANDLMRMVLSAASSDSESEGDKSEIKLRINDQLAWLHTARERTAEVLQQRKRTKKRYALAAEKFNNDPKHWIEYAQQIELLPEELTPESVASFLLHVPGLNKTMIGDYLGDGPDDKYPFNAAVREAYVSMFDFGNTQTLDEALRMFLAKFRLPGEAQKIDRMMECFSMHFYKQCASIGPLLDADAAYVLAFSIIMLNTDLHNDQVAKKMSLDEFLRNNRGINAGQDLPPEYLTTLYERIRDNQIQMQHDVSDLMDSSAALSVVDRYSTSWDGVLKRSENVVGASFTSDASILHLQAGTYEKEMFHLIADKTIQSILLAFEKSCDLTNMERALEGLSNCAKIALYFEMSEVFNSIMSSLSTYFLRFAHGILNGEKVYFFPSRTHSDGELAGQKLANMAHWTGSFQSLSEEEDNGARAEGNAASTKEAGIEADEHAQESFKTESGTTQPADEKYDSELMDPFDASADRSDSGQGTPMRQEDHLNNAKTRRALLSLKQLFRFVQKRHDYFAKAWSSVVECILMFNELDVIPTSLAEMDDFVDSRGVPLPPIQAGNAVESPRNNKAVDQGKDDSGRISHATATGVSGKVREQSRRVAERQAAIRSRVLSNNGTYSANTASSLTPRSNDGGNNTVPTSFWDSLSSYLFAESESTDETFFMVNQMLRDTVSKLGDRILEKENWLRMLRKLREKSLLSLLEVLLSSRDPFKYTVRSSHKSIDIMMQENAILALELSVDLILVNAHRLLSLNLWETFHAYAKRILLTPLAELRMQLLVERVVVHILRVSIRLFHDGKLRPKLMGTLQLLLTMDEEMYQALSDRLACGVNMLLKANLVYLSQDFHDWHVLLGILESLVQYPNGRMLCWDTLQLLSNGGHLNKDNVTLWIAVCLRFVNQPTAHACDALRLLQSLVTEESAFKADEKTWMDVMRMMLSYLHDDRPEVSKTAWECLYCSLLLPSISISEETWIRCFQEDLFPLDDQVAFGAWKHNTAEGNLYSVTLLSKTFLHHMDTLLKSPNFQTLWLEVIARLANKIKASSSHLDDTPTSVYETTVQSICNLFIVMQAEDILSQKFDPIENELKLKFSGGKVETSTNETVIDLKQSTLLQATFMVLDDISPDIREKLGMPLLSGSANYESAMNESAEFTERKTVDEYYALRVEDKDFIEGRDELSAGQEVCDAREETGHKVNCVNVCELMHEEISEAV